MCFPKSRFSTNIILMLNFADLYFFYCICWSKQKNIGILCACKTTNCYLIPIVMHIIFTV